MKKYNKFYTKAKRFEISALTSNDKLELCDAS